MMLGDARNEAETGLSKQVPTSKDAHVRQAKHGTVAQLCLRRQTDRCCKSKPLQTINPGSI